MKNEGVKVVIRMAHVKDFMQGDLTLSSRLCSVSDMQWEGADRQDRVA